MLKTIFKSLLASYQGFSKATWAIIFASFVNSIGTSVAIFLSLYLMNVLNMPINQIGIIISVFGIGTLIGAYIGGLLCDKYNYKKLSIATLLLSGTMTALIPFFSNVTTITVLITFGGLGYGAFKPANSLNLFSGCSSIDRTRVNGLYRVAINLGMGIASLVGGILAAIYFPLVFWFDGISSLVAAGVLLYFNHPSTRIEKNIISNSKNSLNKIFIGLCLLLLTNCLVFFQIRSAYPIYLNNFYHINTTIFGYLFVLNCIIIVLFEVPLLNAIKNLNQILIAATGSILICTSMFILPLSSSLLLAILSCIILSFGEILLFSTLLTLIIDRTNESNKGRYIGIYQSIFGLASMIAPAVGNYLYSLHPSLLWYACGLVGLMSAAGFQFINLILKKSFSLQFKISPLHSDLPDK